MKAHSTQRLANSFPPWSRVRDDDQSVGFQFLNSLGLAHDDLWKQLIRTRDDQYLSTVPVSEIGRHYQFVLPAAFDFARDIDHTELLYDPPTVSGYQHDDWHTISLARDNDIKHFWYEANPTRVALSGVTAAPDQVLASGWVSGSPFIPGNAALSSNNRLAVTVSGGSSFLGVDEGQVTRGLIQIDGTTPEGVFVSEEIPFVYDETQLSTYEYATISGVRAYGIDDPDTTLVEVRESRFNQLDYESAYYIDYSNTGDDIPLFWGIYNSVRENGYPSLDLVAYNQEDVELRIFGFVDKYEMLSAELLDTSENPIYPLDLAVEPHSDRLWVVDANKLYLYKSDLPYPSLQGLEGSMQGAQSQIEIDEPYLLRDQEVTVRYRWMRPNSGLRRHRVWMEEPDGTQYSVEDGVLVAYHTDNTSWFVGEPLHRDIRGFDTFTLDQLGTYIFSLEVEYIDGETELHRRLAHTLSMEPEAELDLSALGFPAVVGVDVDSEYNLWVLCGDGQKRKLFLSYDLMLVDYENKTIYFRDEYSQVRVSE
jgi:hypothetical protein